MQTIVGNIIFHQDGPPDSIQDLSPWLDMRLSPKKGTKKLLAEQSHRRFIKTHLPLDGLKFHEQAKYIMVGRDPRDVFMSLLNHWGNHTDLFYSTMNDRIPNKSGDQFPRMGDDVHETWADWIGKGWFDWENDGYPYWSHLGHCLSWWEFRHLPNIELFHYQDMVDNLEGEMRRVSKYLDIDVPEEAWPRLVDACSFETVKKNPLPVTGKNMDIMFKGGADTFINKGTNGRWKDVLTDDELALYKNVMERTLPQDCAHWLENGGRVN